MAPAHAYQPARQLDPIRIIDVVPDSDHEECVFSVPPLRHLLGGSFPLSWPKVVLGLVTLTLMSSVALYPVAAKISHQVATQPMVPKKAIEAAELKKHEKTKEKRKRGKEKKEMDPVLLYAGATLGDTTSMCKSMVRGLAGAFKANVTCSGVTVAHFLLPYIGAAHKPAVRDVLATVDTAFAQLAKEMNVQPEKLKTPLEKDVDPLSRLHSVKVAKEHITLRDRNLNEIAVAYRDFIGHKELGKKPMLGLDQLESFISIDEFGVYLESVMQNEPKSSPDGSHWPLAALAVLRFLRANSQAMVLRFTRCATLQSECSKDFVLKYVASVKNQMLHYQGIIKDMCMYDITGKRIDELPKGCFNHPGWHHAKEYDSLTGDLSQLPAGVTFLQFTSNNKITGDLQSLQRFPSLKRLDFYANKKIKGDIKWLKDMTQLTFLRFHMKMWMSGDLGSLRGLTQLTYLDFNQNKLITGDLWALKDLKHLTFIDFAKNTRIFGDLVWLSKLTNLGYLDFYWNTQITGDLKSFSKLKQLRHLDFCSDTKIAGDLAELEEMKDLTYLGFAENQKITGNLSSLHGMKKLKFLDMGSHLKGDKEQLLRSTSLKNGYMSWQGS